MSKHVVCAFWYVHSFSNDKHHKSLYDRLPSEKFLPIPCFPISFILKVISNDFTRICSDFLPSNHEVVIARIKLEVSNRCWHSLVSSRYKGFQFLYHFGFYNEIGFYNEKQITAHVVLYLLIIICGTSIIWESTYVYVYSIVYIR